MLLLYHFYGTVAEWAFKAKFENFEAVGKNKF